MKQQVNLEIMDFVEKQILPKYNAFGESHGLRHVTRVIRNSLKLVPVTGADIDMVYVIAAYHDLGMSGPRAIHHITSGKILQADSRLKRWFNKEQIKIMKEAVEDHRASSSRQPRSIYGKIVAEADRDIDVHEIFLRAIQYGKENNPDDDKEHQWERFSQHMDEKYSRNGYIRLWIPNSPNEKALAVQGRQVGKDGTDAVTADLPDHLPVQLHELRQGHVGQMLRLRGLRDLFPAEVAVVAAEVHHQHVAGQLSLQQPVQQAAALADRGAEVGVVMNGKLEFRFQGSHVDLVLGTVAAAAQVHLNSL